MVDQDITQTLETLQTKPDEAVQNIAQASKIGSDPDAYANAGASVDPSKKVQSTVVDRKLASEMEKSNQIASAVSTDVDKMDWSAKMGSFAGLSIRQSDASRERARLANEVRSLKKENKPVPEDLDWNLAAARDEANSISSDIEKLNLSDVSKGVGSIPTFLTDQFKDMWKQKEIVAGTTAAGSVAGAAFGSITIPLVGTFAGWAGGGATGFVVGSMAASSRENYNRTAGEVYDDLSTATKPDGTPLNISEDEKDSIATGVGLASAGVELIADKIGAELIPVFKRVISPKYVREAVTDPVKMGVLRSLGNLAKKAAAGGFAEGSTEAVQEYTQMLGEELGQTWNGKESSLSTAINNLNNKLTKDPSRIKSAAVIGAVGGGTVVGAGQLIPAGRNIVANVPSETPPVVTAPIVEKQPSDFIQIEDGVPVSVSPQKSVNLAVALKGISDATVETKLGKHAPVDAEALQSRMLKESGINQVWVAPEDLNNWSNTQEKADYIRRSLTPSQIKDLEMGASVAIDPQTILEMIRQDETAAKFVRPTADGMSFDEVIASYEQGEARAQEFLKNQGLAEATDAPKAKSTAAAVPLEGATVDTTGLGPESTDEQITSVLGTKQEANAYLDRLNTEETSLFAQAQENGLQPDDDFDDPRYLAVQAMRDRVQSLAESLPDQESAQPAAGERDLTEQEIADASFEAYMSSPLMTDLVRAGVPKETLKSFEDSYRKIREQIVAATQQAADLEMGQVVNQLVSIAELETGLEAVVNATNDPNVASVELFLANREELAIDPDTLSPEQRSRYIDDGVLTARKAFKKGGIDPETLALRLGLTDGDAVLNMLATTPDRKRAVENAQRFSKEVLSLEAADNIEIQSASILKVITDKQKMNLKEFKHFVETSWVKARNGVEGIIYSSVNLDSIREESKTKVQQTKLQALSPKAYERSSKLAAKRKVKAGLRGDTLESARQREIEIRSDELLKQTYETIGKANRATKQINRMMRNPMIQETLRKAGMQDAFVDLASIVNLGDKRDKSDIGAYEKLVSKLDKDQTADISIPQELINTFDPRSSLTDLSYEQVDFIRNKMKELVNIAQQATEFQDGQENKAFDTVKDQVITDIKANPQWEENRGKTGGEFDEGLLDPVISSFDLIDSSMTNIQYTMTQMVDDLSATHQLVVDQLFGIGNYKNTGYGYAAYVKFKGQFQARINQKLEQFGRNRIESYGYTWVDAPELAGSNNLLNKNGRILKSQLMNAVALYGSETGRQRLSNYGVEPDLILEVAKKHLAPEDFDFIQEGVHDTFDLMQKDIERVFKDQGREAPDFVQGLGYEVDGKKYRGGYINIRYRDDVSVERANRADREKTKQLTGESTTRPIEPEHLKDMTRQGQYETRVETFDGIPSLDLATNLSIGIENVITDLSMNIPIKEVMKLLTDDDVSKEMIRVVGAKKHEALKNHVMSAGKSLTTEQLSLFKTLEGEWQGIFNNIGSKVISGTLLGLPSSVISQFSSGFYMWHTLGVRSTGTYVGVWARMILNPKVKIRQMIEWAGKIDPSIGQYAQNIDERTFGEIYNILPKRRSDYKVSRWVETGSNALTRLYFDTCMNTIDTMMKTSAIATAYSRFLSGKTPGYDVKTLAKLSDSEKIRLAESYAFNQINRTGTSGTILDRAYMQKSTVLKGYANYFNDARNVYNYSISYAGRPLKNNIKGIISDMKSGDVAGAARKTYDTGYRLATLQLATAFAATVINAARGRDTEGEDLPEPGTLAWETKMLENLFNNVINPTTTASVVLSGPAIVRDAVYSVGAAVESEGRYINQVMPVHVKAINNIVGGIYVLNQLVANMELTEKESKMLIKGVGSVVPNVPFNAAGKYLLTESEGPGIADAIAQDPGVLVSAVAYAGWVMQQAITKGEFPTFAAAQDIRNTLINPNGSLTAKDLVQGQVKALTPEEIGVIGYTESSGDQAAQAPKGTAAGLYQFTENTWEELMFTYPELGLTYAGRTAKDTKEQEIAMDRLVRDNSVTLVQNNVEIDINSVYAAHHFGAGKIAEIWNLSDKSAVKKFLGDAAYKANPWLKGNVSWVNGGKPVKTVGDFKRGLQDLLDKGRKDYNDAAMKDFALDW